MKIAITGGNGFIGSYLVDELKENGMTPIVLTRDTKYIGYTDTIVTDYRYESLIEQLKEVEAVVHLAFKRGNHGKISEFHDNEVMAQNLFDVCKDLGIRNVINTSTISVYGDLEELPWTENAKIKPELMYGISKFTNECIANIYSDKYNMKIKNLRIAHVFGFNEKNNYMINKFMRLAFNKKTLEIDYLSNSKREFIYVKDVARAIRLSLFLDKSGTYNIGSGINLTNEEVAIRINKNFENIDNLCIKNNRVESNIVKSSYMNSYKASCDFDFQCVYTFDTALEEIYNQMRELDNVPELY